MCVDEIDVFIIRSDGVAKATEVTDELCPFVNVRISQVASEYFYY